MDKGIGGEEVTGRASVCNRGVRVFWVWRGEIQRRMIGFTRGVVCCCCVATMITVAGTEFWGINRGL